MLSYLRHHQKSILLVVTFVVCITFGWFYVRSDTRHGSGEVTLGSIYGRDLSSRDYQKFQKHVEVAVQLQLPNLDELAAGASRDNLMPYLAAVMMVREESAKLGLAVTDDTIEAHIRSLPAFQTDGKWDAGKFRLYAGTDPDNGLVIQRMSMFGQMETTGPYKLSRLGMTVADLYQVVGDYMLFNKLKDLLGAGLVNSDFDGDRNYAIFNQQIKSSVISIPFSRFQETIQVTDDEIQKVFADQKERFMTPEKKAVEFVAIAPENPAAPPPPPPADGKPAPAPQAPAETKEKARERAKLAGEIFDALGDGKELSAIAAEKGLQVVATAPFAVGDTPEQLKDKNTVLAKISGISADHPVPPPVLEGDTWYVLRLKETIAPQPKALADVKEEISRELKDTKAHEAASAAAKDAIAKLKPLLDGGKSFAEAAAAADLKAEDWPVLKAGSRDAKPAERQVRTALQLAKPGSLGDPVTSADAVIIPFLISREIEKSPDRADRAKSMNSYGTQQLRRTVFEEWWTGRRTAAEFVDSTKRKDSDKTGS